MRIVELCGPPGVGKTTLVRRVTHRPKGLPASTTAVPLGVYRAAYQVLSPDTGRIAKFLPHTGRVLAGMEQILARRGGSRWLLEEGSAQRATVWALIDLPFLMQHAYVEALPTTSLTVVLCVADPDTIAARGAARGRPGITRAQATTALAASIWTSEALERRGARLERFNMAWPVAENAARLTDLLHA